MIYLASPYSHPDPLIREQRFREACRHAAFMMRRGSVVFSPIAHTHPIAVQNSLPTGWDFWRKVDTAILIRADSLVVLMLDGWKESKGVEAEIRFAKSMGIPTSYMEPEVQP